MNTDYYIRNLTVNDIPEAMKLVLAEGWNQTEKDWKLFIENPENNCKCLITEGKLVGTATSYRFSQNLAWVSMVLVDKNFRGRGFGKALLESVLNDLNDCKSIKLDATWAGEKVYRKLGFVKEYSISRWVCDSFNGENLTNSEISEINGDDLNSVVAFNQISFGAGREKLISAFINNFPGLTGILKQDGKILGTALGRIGNRYVQIGPVSATSFSAVQKIISSVLKSLHQRSVVLDVLDDKTELADWLTQMGFQKKRQFLRMYLNDNSYKGETELQFVICGPEFG